MTDLVLAPKAPLERSRALAEQYAELARSRATVRAYSGDWRRWTAWCEERGVVPCPGAPAAVAAYLAELAEEGLSVSTICRALSAISQGHGIAGFESPRRSSVVSNTLKGIKRAHGVAQHGKRPLVLADLARVCEALPGWRSAVRDRALFLVGFAGAFRRSELVSLDLEDLTLEDRGYVAHLGRSKTDQVGVGRDVAIPYGSNPRTCPVRAVKAWLEASGIASGALFRRIDRHGTMGGRLAPAAVAGIVKGWAARVGLDPASVSGHSLRSGLATSAAAAGKSERAIMAQTGHRSSAMVRRYIRRATLFEECGAIGIGL